MTLGEASPPRSATRNVTTTLRRMAVGAAGTTCARLESFWLQTSGFLLFLPSPGRSFLTHSCYLTAAKAFMVTSYGLCAWETRGKQRKQPRGISPKARWALTWEPANRNNGEPHKLPAAHLPPGQDKALAGAPRSRVAASSSWDRHGVLFLFYSERTATAMLHLSHSSFIINPLSLFPRQRDYDSDFPCLDADCTNVGGDFLLHISGLQSRDQDSFLMHTLKGWGSCGAACREGLWFAAVTINVNFKTHHDH